MSHFSSHVIFVLQTRLKRQDLEPIEMNWYTHQMSAEHQDIHFPPEPNCDVATRIQHQTLTSFLRQSGACCPTNHRAHRIRWEGELEVKASQMI